MPVHHDVTVECCLLELYSIVIINYYMIVQHAVKVNHDEKGSLLSQRAWEFDR